MHGGQNASKENTPDMFKPYLLKEHTMPGSGTPFAALPAGVLLFQPSLLPGTRVLCHCLVPQRWLRRSLCSKFALTLLEAYDVPGTLGFVMFVQQLGVTQNCRFQGEHDGNIQVIQGPPLLSFHRSLESIFYVLLDSRNI